MQLTSSSPLRFGSIAVVVPHQVVVGSTPSQSLVVRPSRITNDLDQQQGNIRTVRTVLNAYADKGRTPESIWRSIEQKGRSIVIYAFSEDDRQKMRNLFNKAVRTITGKRPSPYVRDRIELLSQLSEVAPLTFMSNVLKILGNHPDAFAKLREGYTQLLAKNSVVFRNGADSLLTEPQLVGNQGDQTTVQSNPFDVLVDLKNGQPFKVGRIREGIDSKIVVATDNDIEKVVELKRMARKAAR